MPYKFIRLSNFYYPRVAWNDCKMHNCSPGQYKCYFYNYCIDSYFYCDGIKHCILGDDEDEENCNKCMKLIKTNSKIIIKCNLLRKKLIFLQIHQFQKDCINAEEKNYYLKRHITMIVQSMSLIFVLVH